MILRVQLMQAIKHVSCKCARGSVQRGVQSDTVNIHAVY
jgi:hypothetical protein